jgi:cytochrome c556
VPRGLPGWANKIPSYFPEGSDSGDTKARAEIWFEFDAFKAKAKANETAAQTLVTAAKSGDQGAMMAGLKNLGASLQILPFRFQRLDHQNRAFLGR